MKLANITPAFKTENFRHESVLSAISKIFLKTHAKANRSLHRKFFVSIFMWL